MQKICKNGSKITNNVPKCSLFNSIQHYLTLKKVFISNMKRIGWPVLTKFDPIWVPNSETNIEYF